MRRLSGSPPGQPNVISAAGQLAQRGSRRAGAARGSVAAAPVWLPPFAQVRRCWSAAASGEEGGSKVAWARGWARQGEEEALLLGSASCLCKMKAL